jgi:hypothetical protein
MPSIQDQHMRMFDRLFAVLIFLCFLGYFTLTVLTENWFGDFGFYLSAVAALQDSLWSPGHETVAGAGIQDALLYSPYIFSVALLGNIFSLSPFATLQLAGTLNLIFYVVAIVHFFRVFSVNRMCWTAPALFLLVSLTVRRFNFCWSSETSLLTFRWVQAYPSTFGWSVVMLTLAEAELYLRSGRSRHLLTIFLGIWCILLSHLLSASWLIGLLGLRLIFRKSIPAEESLGKSWRLAATMVLSLVATPVWPYLDILRILALAGHPENPPFGQNVLSEIWYPFLLGVPALLYFLKRGQHRLIVVWFTGTWFAFLTCKLLGLSFGNRYIFFQQFFLHIAIAEILTTGYRSVVEKRTEPLDRTLMGIMGICTIGILASPQIFEAFRGPNRLKSPLELLGAPPNRQVFLEKWGAYSPHVNSSDIVLTPVDHHYSPAYLATYTGCRSIVGPYALPRTEQTKVDMARFLDPSLPWSERQPVLEKYKVTKVLIPRVQEEQFGPIEDFLGPAIYRGEDYIVFSVGPG